MNKDDRVYLSGPITGVVDYKERFKRAQRELWSQGFDWVINPAEVIQHLPRRMTYEQIMAQCYSMMSMCDTILLLPGWRASEGCRREEAYAKAHGMKIEEVKENDMENDW